MADFPLFSLSIFAASMFFTPGPNNTMLAFSGARFGLKKTWYHIFGVTIGFSLMVLILGLGIGKLMIEYKYFETAVNVISFLFLIWYLYMVIYSSPPAELNEIDKKQDQESVKNQKKQRTKPLNFIQALLFQWINAKAWVIGLAMLGQFLRPVSYYEDLVIVSVTCVVIGTCSACVWCYFGTILGRVIKSPVIYRTFCLIVALLLVVSIAPLYINLIV